MILAPVTASTLPGTGSLHLQQPFITYIARADFNVDRSGKHTLFWRGSLQGDANVSAPQFLGGDPVRTTLTNSRGIGIGYPALLTPS